MTKAVQEARETMHERIGEPDDELQQSVVDLTSLSDILDMETVGWRPEPGDKLIGQVLYVTETDGGHPEFNKEGTTGYPLVAVVTTDGELIAVHAFHSVLRSAIEGKVAQGDGIGIKYLGRKTEGGRLGTGYENYNVVVQKARPALAGAQQAAIGSGS